MFTDFEIACEILKNMAGEGSAQADYSTLIDHMVKSNCSKKDIAIIEEIMSDERNHTLKLFNLAQKFCGIKTTNDDKKEIIENITNGFNQ